MDKLSNELPKSVTDKFQFLQATKNVIKDLDFHDFKLDKCRLLQSPDKQNNISKPSDSLAQCVSERTVSILNSSKTHSSVSLTKLRSRHSSDNLNSPPIQSFTNSPMKEKFNLKQWISNGQQFNDNVATSMQDKHPKTTFNSGLADNISYYKGLLAQKICKPEDILISFEDLDSIKPVNDQTECNFVRGLSGPNRSAKSTSSAPEEWDILEKPIVPSLVQPTVETRPLASMQEYDDFRLSNVDWDNENVDWAANALDDYPDEVLDAMDDIVTAANETNIPLEAGHESTLWSTSLNSSIVPAASCSSMHFVPIDKDAGIRKDDTAAFQKAYPHSAILRDILHERFGLKAFRPNQEEIINASLEQHDCFVLMPTGGGKSLCYQLPALLVPGVTIVISPLRALIVDQVNKLKSLDIPAAHMCADITKDTYVEIMKALNQLEPTLKLLFLTPEKIVGSRQTFDTLELLYKRQKLARIVLDEAHCLSHWGHDFRPDYKQLSTLRRNFPKTPIMCLTATATSVVQQDVAGILKLSNVKSFIRSFNRPNIKYAVVEKSKAVATDAIGNLIQKRFSRKSGIVYTLSRKDCDTLALDLRKFGIKAISYHAGLSDTKRERAQTEWMNNQAHVICATIAFGMGIDKPDVRFVIHNSLPKSVEGFYQESGRGGRDGETAYSYLFYSYADVIRLKKVITLDKTISKHNLEAHFDQISQMAQYCENRTDCRRYLQLLHLGEKFDRRLCMANKITMCDNCGNSGKVIVQDVVKESRELATIVKDLGTHRNFTMLYFVDVYKGSKLKKILEWQHNQHRFFGAGAHLDKTDIQRIMKQLSFKKVFADYCSYNGEFPVTYLKPGANYARLFDADATLALPISKPRTKTLKVTSSEEIDSQDSASGGTMNAADPKPSSLLQGVKRSSKSMEESPSKSRDREVQALKTKCHEELLEQCAIFAGQFHSNLSSIMNLAALKTMSEELPSTADDFLKIQYVTKANFDKFGKEFLAITSKYHAELEKIEMQTALETFQNDFEDDWATDSKTKTGKSSAASTSKAAGGSKGKYKYNRSFKRFKSAKKK